LRLTPLIKHDRKTAGKKESSLCSNLEKVRSAQSTKPTLMIIISAEQLMLFKESDVKKGRDRLVTESSLIKAGHSTIDSKLLLGALNESPTIRIMCIGQVCI